MSADLGKLDRGDLNTVAAALGVTEPDKLANKDEVAKAILDTAAPRDQKLTARIAELEAELKGREPVEDTREIERIAYVDGTPGQQEVERAWWCPFCDHSNSRDTPTCGGCGAERDGDEATRRTYETQG